MVESTLDFFSTLCMHVCVLCLKSLGLVLNYYLENALTLCFKSLYYLAKTWDTITFM